MNEYIRGEKNLIFLEGNFKRTGKREKLFLILLFEFSQIFTGLYALFLAQINLPTGLETTSESP
jgi:hypothetical protein